MPNASDRSAHTLHQERWRARYGPWAVVTGASDGIGRAMARCLAAAGLDLVLVARRRAVLDELAAELTARYGIATRVLDVDLALDAAAATVATATHDLDVGLLVAAAGFGTSGPFLDARLAQELEMLHVNCRAPLALSLHFGRRFANRRRGGVVLMGSLLAFQGVPYAAHYAATKAYMQTFAEGLHAELAPLGVDVVASAPGPVHSGFAARADMRLGRALTPHDVAGATLAALGRRSTVRPGWQSQVLEGALAPLPRRARVRVMGTIMAGMTRHRRE
jgi:short-subunit dehydrogenase